jgi:hypothetical protein
MDNFFENNKIQNVFLVLVLCISYLPVLVAKKTVNIDAQLIMPLLQNLRGLSHYLEILFSFEAYDVQPVRDLTLFVDLFIFNKINFNTFIIQNISYWIVGCLSVKRLIKLIFKEFTNVQSFYLTLLFAIYPLFCATLSWGIARKHVLSFMFIMLSTEYFLKMVQDKFENKNLVLMSTFYFLSVFSQPITLLWPFWTILYVLIIKPESLKKWALLISPSLVIFSVCTYFNYLYYKNSNVFRFYYESKTADALNIADKILGFGHYVYQLVLPYWPATSYQLGHWSVLAGIFLFGAFIFLFLGLKQNRSFLLLWFGFTLFPLAVVLTNAHVLSDNYLLAPSFGCFILLLSLLNRDKRIKTFFFTFLFLPLLAFWSFYTNQETKLWTDPIAFSKIRNFGRRPNCDSAVNLARKSYSLLGTLPKEAKKYLESYECLNLNVPVAAIAISNIYLQTFILYYETDIAFSQRVEALKKLSKIYYYSKLVLAVLYIENQNENEGIELVEEVYRDYDKIKWSNYYDLIMAKKLAPYCKGIGHVNCLKITDHYSIIPDVSYF